MQLLFLRSTRSRLLIWAMLVIGVIFVARLFYLQVLQHGYYESEALKEHTTKFTLPAQRGLIYARDGSKDIVPLVLNEAAYTVYADPRYVADVSKTAATLRRIAGGEVVSNLEESLGDRDRQYVVLGRQLSNDQAQLLKKENLPGIGLQAQDRRVYPEGQLASQLLGYVNNDEEGQYGLEQYLNDELAGKAGLLKAVTDVHGIPISIDKNDVQVPAQNGKNIVLTIDRNIQAYAEQALKSGLDKAKAEHGSILIMNPRSGAVLAMANLPTYDPAKYYDVKDYSTFLNATVSDPYEAGSVVKSLTMAAGLNEGVIKKDSTYQNDGHVQVDDATIKNVLQVNGTRSMTEILQYSLNTGAVYILNQLGGGSINKAARDKLFGYFDGRYQFGKRTGVEQANEAAGKIFGPEDEQGNNVRYANMTFGQGMNTTMLQVASAFSAVINGGSYYQPRLVSGTVSDNGMVIDVQSKLVKSGIVANNTTNDLRSMLEVARAKTFPGVDKAGYHIGGKTGTSQTIDPKTGKYVDDNAIGTYIGYGGNDTSDYVIMVRVVDSKAGGYAGSVAAAPIFADVSNWLIDYLKIQPSR